MFGESLIQNAAIATSAYLFTAPIIIFYFGRISPVAPLANLLVAEAVFPMMILGFLTAIASLIFMPLAQVVAYFAFVPAFYFSMVVKIFAALPFAQYSFGQGNWIMAIAIYLILFTLLWITRAKQY
jgi:competence protein ComEC